MDDAAFARALHVRGVALWIGGTGFVTTVLLPSVRRERRPEERLHRFLLAISLITVLGAVAGSHGEGFQPRGLCGAEARPNRDGCGTLTRG